jgi:hypothetical protein
MEVTCADRLLLVLSLFVRAQADGFSFVAIGDWGGDGDDQPTTETQVRTGRSMMRQSISMGADFALMMGDNFYYHGIRVPDDQTSRFERTFEDVYVKHQPDQKFYAMAGNHDYGEGCLSNVSAQLGYSHRSAAWEFPSLWYSLHRDFVIDTSKRSLDLIIIDTVVLCGNGENDVFIDQQLEFLGLSRDPAMPGKLRRFWAEQQWHWLEESLSKSTADFLWVSGHYPIYSAGSDGSQQCLIDRLLPLLQKYGAHYISGHDHMLEHFVHGRTHLLVIGAGKECCYDPVNLDQVPNRDVRFITAGYEGRKSQPPLSAPLLGGFAALSFGTETASATIFDHDGRVLYSIPDIPSRHKSIGLASQPLAVPLVVVAALAVAAVLVAIVRQKRRKLCECDMGYSLLQ